MRKFLIVRAILLSAFFIWAALYFPVYFRSGEIVAPFSACQIPLLPVFGVGFGYVLYAVAVCFCVVTAILSFWEKFSKRIYTILPMSLLCVLDIVGLVFRFRSASFEQREEKRLTAYYYFNNITPTPPEYFVVSIVLDLVFLILLLLPVFLKEKAPKAEVFEDGGITTDVWSDVFEFFDAPQDLGEDMGEEYKPECEKK